MPVDESGQPSELALALPQGVQRLRVFQGRENLVVSIAWSPDGTRLATGSLDETRVRIWSSDSGEVLYTSPVYPSSVKTVAWSPDGQQLAFGFGTEVWIWGGSGGEPLQCQGGHHAGIWSLAWSSDGRRLAGWSVGWEVRVWDGSNGCLLYEVPGHTEGLRLPVAWSPDGELLATGQTDGLVRIWNGHTGQLLHKLEGDQDKVWSLAWSPDGMRLAASTVGNSARIWDSGGRLHHVLRGHTKWVRALAWSPDGRLLATGSADKTIRLWDRDSGMLLRTLDDIPEGLFSALGWSSDGRWLAASTYAGRPGQVSIWHTSDWILSATFPLPGLTNGKGFIWHPDQPLLIAPGPTRAEVSLWQLAIGPGFASETRRRPRLWDWVYGFYARRRHGRG